MRCVVLGPPKCGKTSILLTLSRTGRPLEQPYLPTLEDTFLVQTGTDSAERPREHLVFYDTAGQTGAAELKRPLLQVADVFLLVFSVLDRASFQAADQLKKQLDRQLAKEKRDVSPPPRTSPRPCRCRWWSSAP